MSTPARTPARPAGMAGLAASVKANQKPLMIGAAGLVALLAFLRSRGQGGAEGPGAAAPTPMFAGQSVGGAAYDSSASDVYNALQPQIEQTQNMLTQAGTESQSLFEKLTEATKKALDAATSASKAATTATTASKTATTASQTAAAAATKAQSAATRVPTPAPPTPAKAAPAPKPAAPAPVKAPATVTYTVKKGDSLSAIGARYGITWTTIYNSNKSVIGKNPNLILPGQKLVIPKK